ncbi:MAG TPA: hypothetical protein VHA79_10545 [Mycobacteriales bacterium]|jgi:hypothetical protein|nr:hypothetical protein [Mycobacteriales bacterium]
MRTRRLTQALLAGGVAALGVGGFAPTIASAASADDTLTVAGGSSYTYTFNQSPSIQATAEPNCKGVLSRAGQVTLSIAGPAVTQSTLVSHKGDCNKALAMSPSSSSVNTRHPAWAGGSAMASNGVYTVTLDNQGRTKQATFTLLIPPAKPSGFSVTPNSASSATFNWTANPEPDITGYEISNGSGSVASATSAACSAGACSTGPVDLGSSVAGHTERYTIAAIRSCGNASCSGGHIASGSAASASGTFPAAPAPPPSPTPTTSTGGGDNGGGHSGGGTQLGTVHSNGGGSHSGSVNLGNADPSGQVSHNLPPVSVGSIPAVHAPPLPSVRSSIRPLDLGDAPTKIKYPKPLLAQKQAAKENLLDSVKSGLSLPPLWRGIAAAAVLILIAVHLRAWVSRTEAF